MNENAKKWVAALRSGKYEQTTGTLADDTGYCCLGVACEVAIANGLDVVKTKIIPLGSNRGDIYYDEESGVLPLSVREWLRLTSENGDYLNGDGLKCLTKQNDLGATFEEIANIIETHATTLFYQ